MSEKSPLHDLRWVRVFTPIHIPKYLVEQVKDREFDVDKFYVYQQQYCTIHDGENFKLNPYNHLWVLVNLDNITKGFVWFTIDPLGQSLVVHTYSIDPEYWFQNRAVSKLADFIKDFMKTAQLKRVFWISKYPKHQEKYGFRRSKNVLMEYTEEEENGKHGTSSGTWGSGDSIRLQPKKKSAGRIRSEEHRSDESSTDANSEPDSSATGIGTTIRTECLELANSSGT